MNVAIVQHFLAHYRHKTFNDLSLSSRNNFIFYSDINGLDGVNVIDFKYSKIDPNLNGIRWRLVKNLRLGKYFLWQTGLIRLALNKEFDVIIYLGNMYHLSTWVSAILAKISGKKILMWTHGFLSNEPGIKGFFRLNFYRLADGLLLYGHRSREILISKGYLANKLEVIYNSLNYSKQIAVRESLTHDYLEGLKNSLFSCPLFPVLVFIGRFTRQKKLNQLIDAVHILHKRLCPVNILFIGSGPEKISLIEYVAKLKLSEYVNFYGETYDENEIGGLISLSDICVSPGEVGLICMHVMAYGVPVITHNDFNFQGPEVEAIQEGVTGSFFEKDNFVSLANSIYKFLNLKLSSNVIKSNCIHVIESKYNSDVQVKIINDFIENLFIK